MSAQVRLEALKLAIEMGERDNPLTLAAQFEAYITGGTIAPAQINGHISRLMYWPKRQVDGFLTYKTQG